MMIALEPFEEKDFDRLIGWIDSAESLLQFAGPIFKYPLNHAQLAEYLLDAQRTAYRVKVAESGIVIGHAELYSVSENTMKICRVLIGDSSFRGQGFGRQIIRNLILQAFSNKIVEKVELNVFDWNTAAIHCYQKEGFNVLSNVSKSIEVNGKIWKSIQMAVLRSQLEANTL